MDLGVVSDRVGVVEPAVVSVSLLAVHEWEGLYRLRQVIRMFHLNQSEVTAVSLTSVLLLSCTKGSALHTRPVKQHAACYASDCD